MDIRSATIEDAARLLEIYAYYVEHTAVSFDVEVPSLDSFTSRIARTLERFPYLVVEEEGQVQGYCYAGPLIPRAASDHCCELSIYLDRHARRRGYGRALYDEMERRLRERGILNLYASIADPIEEDEYLTHDSERFHARLGFTKVGDFHKCGRKFGRWYNLIWMEKLVAAAPEDA
jgi:phosphinothricin acetyltransferase